MERRDFLTKSLLGGLGLSLSGKIWSASNINLKYKNDPKALEKLISKSKGSFKYLTMSGIDPTIDFINSKSNDGDVGAVRPGVAFFNDNLESAVVDVPMFPHSIEQNPDYPNRIMLIAKKNATCIEYDVLQNKITNELTLKDKKFYGHGCYVTGTDYFYASTFSYDTSKATMVLFDLKTKQVVKEIQIPGGSGSHQCSLSHDKKSIIMTFSKSSKGHKPSVAWFDIKTGELTDRVYGLRENAEHFDHLSDGYLIFTGGVAGSKEQTVIGSISPEKQVTNFEADKDHTDHFSGLSVSIVGLESRGVSFMSNAVENSIYVLNYKTGKLIKRIEIPVPRGLNLTNDGKYLIATSLSNMLNKDALISLIDVENFEVKKQFKIENALAYSSHASKFIIG